MISSINLLTAILNLSNGITNILFRKNITKKDIEEILIKYDLTKSIDKEKIFVVLNENQELIYSDENGDFRIKNRQITKNEFNSSQVAKICEKFDIESSSLTKENRLKDTYKTISKKW